MTNENRWRPSGIVCAESTSSVSVCWTVLEKSLRCLCRRSREKSNGTRSYLRTWAERRHVARGGALGELHRCSICLYGWLAEHLGTNPSSCSAFVWRQHFCSGAGASLPCCSYSSVFPSFLPFRAFSLFRSMCDIHLHDWLIRSALNKCSDDTICSIHHLCSHLFPFPLFTSLSVFSVVCLPWILLVLWGRKTGVLLSLQSPRTTRLLLERGLPDLYTWPKDEELFSDIYCFQC